MNDIQVLICSYILIVILSLITVKMDKVLDINSVKMLYVLMYVITVIILLINMIRIKI